LLIYICVLIFAEYKIEVNKTSFLVTVKVQEKRKDLFGLFG